MQSSGPVLPARAQSLIAAILTLLALVALSPLADILVPALPFATGEVRWRFQTFGSLLASLPQLAIVLAVIVAVGVLGGHRVAVRGVAVVAGILAVVAVILLPFFTLDFLEMRRLVALDRRSNFDVAAMKTGAFGGLLGLALAYLSWKAFPASSKDKDSVRKAEGAGLIVGQD